MKAKQQGGKEPGSSEDYRAAANKQDAQRLAELAGNNTPPYEESELKPAYITIKTADWGEEQYIVRAEHEALLAQEYSRGRRDFAVKLAKETVGNPQWPSKYSSFRSELLKAIEKGQEDGE